MAIHDHADATLDPSEPHFDHCPDFRQIGAEVFSTDHVFDGEDHGHTILEGGHTYRLRGANRFQSLIVEHGAVLWLDADSSLCFKDATLADSAFDPKRFSNGLIVLGSLLAEGEPVAPAWDNLARQIVIKSENPLGVRGHVMLMHRAFIDITGVEFAHLGRTTTAPLNPVANAIGRYALHLHGLYGPKHCHCDYQSRIQNCSIHHGKKWLAAIHNTAYCHFLDNVLQYADGAGLILEEGNEDRNVIRAMVGDITGNGLTPDQRGGASTPGSDFGFEGVGLWARTLLGANDIDVTVRNAKFAATVMAQHSSKQATVALPNFKGANTQVAGQFTATNPRNGGLYTPVKLTATEGIVNGVETWNADGARVLAPGSVVKADKLGVASFFSIIPVEQVDLAADICFIHQNRKLSAGVYSAQTTIKDSTLTGRIGAAIRMKLGATFQRVKFACHEAAIHMDWRIDNDHDLIIEDCTNEFVYPEHDELAGMVKALPLVKAAPIDWAGFARSAEANFALCPVRILIKQGDTYLRGYVPEQARDYIPPASSALGILKMSGSPEPGLTNAELDAKYGVATLGYVTPEDAVWDASIGLHVSPVSGPLPPRPEKVGNPAVKRVGDVATFSRVKFVAPAEPLLALLVTNGGAYQWRLMANFPLATEHVLTFAGTAAKTQVTVWFRSAEGAISFESLGQV